MKCGVFCKKVENGGGVFCKKWTFPQMHYVQYQYFLFYILLIGGRTHPRTPVLTESHSPQGRDPLVRSRLHPA